MKPNYGNWIPNGMLIGFFAASALLLAGALVFALTGLVADVACRLILSIVFTVAFILCLYFSIWCAGAYHAFSYRGKRRLSSQIVEGVAAYVSVPAGGKVLDVGCGSGALTIACAKRNPGGTVTGLDRWGKDYAFFTKQRCEANAKAEGVGNACFVKGDATKLAFPDESFDAVTSNYVYHNIPGKNKQILLLETLRVLKKGGVFVIHDLMSPARYGDMHAFVETLKIQGFKKVALIDTTNGMFMSPKEAKRMLLEGSTVLYGVK